MSDWLELLEEMRPYGEPYKDNPDLFQNFVGKSSSCLQRPDP